MVCHSETAQWNAARQKLDLELAELKKEKVTLSHRFHLFINLAEHAAQLCCMEVIRLSLYVMHALLMKRRSALSGGSTKLGLVVFTVTLVSFCLSLRL